MKQFCLRCEREDILFLGLDGCSFWLSYRVVFWKVGWPFQDKCYESLCNVLNSCWKVFQTDRGQYVFHCLVFQLDSISDAARWNGLYVCLLDFFISVSIFHTSFWNHSHTCQSFPLNFDVTATSDFCDILELMVSVPFVRYHGRVVTYVRLVMLHVLLTMWQSC